MNILLMTYCNCPPPPLTPNPYICFKFEFELVFHLSPQLKLVIGACHRFPSLPHLLTPSSGPPALTPIICLPSVPFCSTSLNFPPSDVVPMIPLLPRRYALSTLCWFTLHPCPCNHPIYPPLRVVPPCFLRCFSMYYFRGEICFLFCSLFLFCSVHYYQMSCFDFSKCPFHSLQKPASIL